MRAPRIALLTLCGTMVAAQPHRPPRFEDFPVREVYHGRPAPLDVANAEGARFRTILRGAARAGAKFAGHYGAAEWGCGSPCQMMAIVDLRTGRMAFAPESATVGYAYRVDSSLLVVDPPDEWRKAYGDCGSDAIPRSTRYFRWIGGHFVRVDSIAPPLRPC